LVSGQKKKGGWQNKGISMSLFWKKRRARRWLNRALDCEGGTPSPKKGGKSSRWQGKISATGVLVLRSHDQKKKKPGAKTIRPDEGRKN